MTEKKEIRGNVIEMSSGDAQFDSPSNLGKIYEKEILINDDSKVRGSGALILREHTTIFGKLMKVGGIEPHVYLRIPGQKRILRCNVNPKQAIELGARIYTNVCLSGVAEIEFPERSVLKFTVHSIEPYDERKWDDSVRKLSEIVSPVFKDINVDDYISEMREGS